MEVRNIIRVPVKKYVCEYLFNFHQSKNNSPYLILSEDYFLNFSIINFIKVEGKSDENFIPLKTEPYVYLQTAKVLGIIGLSEQNAKRLGNFINRYVTDKICEDVCFYSSLPGISITESILTVLGKYDIASLRTDTFRRTFDRKTKEMKFHIDVETVNFRINKSLKSIYGEKYANFLSQK